MIMVSLYMRASGFSRLTGTSIEPTEDEDEEDEDDTIDVEAAPGEYMLPQIWSAFIDFNSGDPSPIISADELEGE